MADPVYLEGVVINLIDNSLKYAGPKPEIGISIECTGKTKKLIVRDNGPGIPDDYREQIFDKFFRIPAGNRHNVKGYGLGLNFASQVMSRLGGAISYRNLSGEGCEFILEFPNQ
jgi:signal transduction histidine kinase